MALTLALDLARHGTLFSTSLLSCSLFFFLALAQRRNGTDGDTVETNVLVVGMPNVGKSTLLNALRNEGIAGR